LFFPPSAMFKFVVSEVQIPLFFRSRIFQ